MHHLARPSFLLTVLRPPRLTPRSDAAFFSSPRHSAILLQFWVLSFGTHLFTLYLCHLCKFPIILLRLPLAVPLLAIISSVLSSLVLPLTCLQCAQPFALHQSPTLLLNYLLYPPSFLPQSGTHLSVSLLPCSLGSWHPASHLVPLLLLPNSMAS